MVVQMKIDEIELIIKKYPNGIEITDLVKETELKYPKLSLKTRKLKWNLKVYHEPFFDEMNEFRLKIKHISFKSDFYIEFYVKDLEYYDDFILNTLYNNDSVCLLSKEFFEKYHKEYDFYILKNRMEYLKISHQISYIHIMDNDYSFKYFMFESWNPLIEIPDNFKRRYNMIKESRTLGYKNNVKLLNKDKRLKKEEGRRIYEESMRRHYENIENKRNTIVIVDLPNLINSIEKFDLNIYKRNNLDKFNNLSSMFIKSLLTNVDDELFEKILQTYIFTEIQKVHNFVFFTTPKYKRFNEFLFRYKYNNSIKDRVSLKTFAIPIINTRYFKDIDKQMNEYIRYISSNLSMKKFVIVTGDAHFYTSILNLGIKNINIHIIAHEGSMSNYFKDFESFNEKNNKIYSYTLIKRNDYYRKKTIRING
jgi:hypothetical protein